MTAPRITLEVFTSDASASTRPRKYHWPKGDGTSLCGRATINGDPPGRDPQMVPPFRWCRASGCRQKYDDVLPGANYWLDECGCVEYVGDLDARHYIHRCAYHEDQEDGALVQG